VTGAPGEDGGRTPPNLPEGTEAVNPASLGIDRKSAREIVEIIHQEDLKAWQAIEGALDDVACLVDRVVEAFRYGGRLIYVGAGTSGRLGVLDASECPPTFGVRPELVLGLIAGGETALRSSIEGAEDSPEDGARAIRENRVRDRDVVCGIASSGKTPYVMGALEEAMRRDATTALISCNPLPRGLDATSLADLVIELPVGPEVISGSTRMKGGTATKMVLNMLSTAAMVRWGKVYDNLMVDLRPVNRKLVRRAIRLIESVGEVDKASAAKLLTLAENSVKAAIVMARRGVDSSEAIRLLAESSGSLRSVIDPPGDTCPPPSGAPPRQG
jgi:N-acetylmuramic acid 6-phosphate etherase